MIVRQKPKVVWMAPPRTAWSMLQDAQPFHKIAAKQEKAMSLVLLCERIAQYHLSQGRRFFIENPTTSKIWYQTPFQLLLKASHVTWCTTDFCMHGMRGPDSGLPWRKSVSFIHNMPEDLLAPVMVRCNHTGPHESVQGRTTGGVSRATLSAECPWLLCKRLFHKLADHLGGLSTPTVSRKVANLVSDLIDISGATEAEVKQWRNWYTLATKGRRMLSTPPPVAKELPVLNPEIRRLTSTVDALPRGVEFRQ